MEGTRVELGDELDNWEKCFLDASTMMWVKGGAGTGKTALLFTFADLCRLHGRSAGAFFASNRIASCSDGNRIFATLAIQLMETMPSTKRYISRALRNDPLLFSRGREVQMTKLIVEPIRKVAKLARFLKAIGLRSYPTLIVIDGLDEIDGKDVQSDIIRIIGNAMKDVGLPLRFLIASRPEPHICQAIDKLRSEFTKDPVSTIDLKEDALVRGDLHHYFRVKFQEARVMHPELPAEWPGADVITQLVDKASGQFIYATTIMLYIMSPYYSSDDRLAIIRGLMEKPPGDTPFHSLDGLYSHIVLKATRRETILQIMAFLIVINNLSSSSNIDSSNSAAQLCSPQKLDQILGFKQGEVRRCLIDMHSLVDIREEDDRNIRIYHKSFPDFLLDESRSHELYIELTDQVYDRVYSHIIRSSKHAEIILQVIGQVIIAENMSSHVDVFGIPGNSTSPKRIEAVLGIEGAVLVKIAEDMHLLLQVETEDQDIIIRHPSFLVFLLDQSRSQSLFVDVDYARLTLRFSSQIRSVFNATGTPIKPSRIRHLTTVLSVLSEVLSAMRNNKELVPWLEDNSVSDWVYSHFVSNYEHQDVILQILGQVILAHNMPSDVDVFGSPANSSSPNRIENVLGLERGTIMEAFEDTHLTHESLHDGQDIKIRHPSFLNFLLDGSRSQKLFIDIDYARLTFRFSSQIRSAFSAAGVSTKCVLSQLQCLTLILSVHSKVLETMRRNKETIPQLQDNSIFDWVYPHVVFNSNYRDLVLGILGQVIITNSMPLDVDVFGTPANSSSPNRIENILGLERGTVTRALADLDLTHEPLHEDQDIKIRYPAFLDFLLDRSRSQQLFVDIKNARLTLQFASQVASVFSVESV